MRMKQQKIIVGRRGIRHAWKEKINEIKNRSVLDPVIYPGSSSNKEMKRRTGFKSERQMFKYICIVCDGDINKMISTESHLTWYEEWMIFFEYLWGRTHSRFEDLSALYKVPKKEVVYRIFDQKLYLALVCRASWPTYVRFKEDEVLRDSKWNSKYEHQRIIMWDDTNVPLYFKPSGAVNQRITYSAYYSQNCAKGGIFLQLCGWMGVAELWVGGTSDSYYMQHADEILKRQEEFARNDLVNGKYIPFHLLLDKGYRIVRDAFRFGGQICIQPMFAESDSTFTSNEMLYSASVAADRSGNERAVNRAKLSGAVKRGLYPRTSPIRLNKIWEAWSFQTNFMYAPML